MIIKLKWLWKNKKDEDQTVIRNKARLVAKGYAQEEDADHAGCIDTRKSTSGGIQSLVVRLGINPMIQPEPEDLPKDNPKLEIAVLRFPAGIKILPIHSEFARTFRVILFSIHNDEWKSFQCHHQTALR
ncbi:hypothetical protein Tco_1030622 [Tanacetum coccineum]|uniref:Uncharacterized protein n=1 Tax=Tanacetum coccineum TaxID=301880 RepID=A0ABQ5G7C5_9ASTR